MPAATEFETLNHSPLSAQGGRLPGNQLAVIFWQEQSGNQGHGQPIPLLLAMMIAYAMNREVPPPKRIAWISPADAGTPEALNGTT
jgi:hypothetical protein